MSTEEHHRRCRRMDCCGLERWSTVTVAVVWFEGGVSGAERRRCRSVACYAVSNGRRYQSVFVRGQPSSHQRRNNRSEDVIMDVTVVSAAVASRWWPRRCKVPALDCQDSVLAVLHT
nr:hypothetical protein Iba_chr04eCG6580 [Ipomoea batatas]